MNRSLALLFLFVLSGCAVAPEPLTPAQVGGFVDEANQRFALDADYSGLALTRVIQKAMDNSPDLRTQRLAKLVALQDTDFNNRQLLIGAMFDVGYGIKPNDDNSDYEFVKSNVTFYWSALDFGISYLRAKSSANSFLITQEQERHQRNLLVADIVKFWYLAKFYHEQEARIERLKRQASAHYREGMNSISGSADAAKMSRSSELADGMYWLVQQEDDFRSSLFSLNKIMGANLEYKPARFGPDDLAVAAASYRLDTLFEQAVLQRPEVRNSIYEARNQKITDQTRLLSLLPLPRLSAGTDFRLGEGDFLTGSWIAASAKLIGNLSELVALPSAQKLREKREDLAVNRLLAIARMVQLQTGLAYVEMGAAREKSLWARRNMEAKSAIRKQAAARPASEQDDVQNTLMEMRSISAELRYTRALIDYKVALVKLSTSAGYDGLYHEASIAAADQAGQLK